MNEIADVIRTLKEGNHNQVVTLKPAVSESDILSFEQRLNLRLPTELREFYRFSNGFETEELLFRILPLEEILEQKDEYEKDEFYIAEYLIYSDIWTLRVNKLTGQLSIYNSDHSSRHWMFLTNSFSEFITRFLNYGLFEEHGLYDWVNEEKADSRVGKGEFHP
ncbi:SMI1/KNR4 family protein [Echinicola shivajiensis]|uniref:SMI1/KNR4 family protein n=1 Tax=Echinicola shivajiensis TaxID=1035916 RepID=UPI001BFC7AB2|nr:SMI1/KNR4 family protein [Echinicola shivajiensis]